MSIVDIFKSLVTNDVGEMLSCLRSDSLLARKFAAAGIKDLSSHGEVPNEAVPQIVSALHSDYEHEVAFSIAIALCYIGTKEAIMGVDWYLSKMVRDAIYEEGIRRHYAAGVLYKISDHINSNFASYNAIRFALLRLALDPNINGGRRVESYRTLKRVDPSLVNMLNSEDRAQFEMAAEVTDNVEGIVKASTKVVRRIIPIILLNAVIAVFSSGEFDIPLKNFGHLIIDHCQDRKVSYKSVELSDGTKIKVPETSDIPNTELFKFLEKIIDVLTAPYSTIPPDLRPQK